MNYPTIKLSRTEERVMFWGYVILGVATLVSYFIFHNEAVAFGLSWGCAMFWAAKTASIPNDKKFRWF